MAALKVLDTAVCTVTRRGARGQPSAAAPAPRRAVLCTARDEVCPTRRRGHDPTDHRHARRRSGSPAPGPARVRPRAAAGRCSQVVAGLQREVPALRRAHRRAARQQEAEPTRPAAGARRTTDYAARPGCAEEQRPYGESSCTLGRDVSPGSRPRAAPAAPVILLPQEWLGR
jgi:hypothetical protein